MHIKKAEKQYIFIHLWIRVYIHTYSFALKTFSLSLAYFDSLSFTRHYLRTLNTQNNKTQITFDAHLKVASKSQITGGKPDDINRVTCRESSY